MGPLHLLQQIRHWQSDIERTRDWTSENITATLFAGQWIEQFSVKPSWDVLDLTVTRWPTTMHLAFRISWPVPFLGGYVRGCLPRRGCNYLESVCLRGVCIRGGVCLGECMPRGGVCLVDDCPGGGSTPSPVNRMIAKCRRRIYLAMEITFTGVE